MFSGGAGVPPCRLRPVGSLRAATNPHDSGGAAVVPTDLDGEMASTICHLGLARRLGRAPTRLAILCTGGRVRLRLRCGQVGGGERRPPDATARPARERPDES